jgi:hypothetical protein
MRAVRRRLVQALGIRTPAGLDDVPAPVPANARGLAGKTFCIAIAAVYLGAGRGENGSHEEGDGTDEEGGKFHGVDDNIGGGGLVVMS